MPRSAPTPLVPDAARDVSTKSSRPQWGSDRRPSPLPPIPEAATDGTLTRNRLAIVLTVLAWLAYAATTIGREFFFNGVENMRFAAEALVYLFMVTLLSGSAIAYLLSRQGFLHRTRDHRRTPRSEIDAFFSVSMPTVTVLVPSYREEPGIVRQTVLSAALQEYPYLRVVVLVDDPVAPEDPAHQATLAATRALPGELERFLAAPRAKFEAALERYEQRSLAGPIADRLEPLALAGHYDDAADWLTARAKGERVGGHAEAFFADHVMVRLARDFETTATALRAAACAGATLPPDRVHQLYRRLAWIFRAEVTVFERKQYASLSHEPNKAMNINSYLGLMGQSLRRQETPDGTMLVPAGSAPADVEVPDPDYVLTLDADSVLLPEYLLRLVYLLEQPEHARVGVAQTPYSAYPGSATRLERLAGATTDLQHRAHQGMCHYGAAFWVGANAVLRKAALDEMGETDVRDGRSIRRFVSDRTVIEDTESSLDLTAKGWTLLNYPERLSYSATPPDFGSLCIQRQRWANGGLLIVPKLWRHLRARRRHGVGGWFAEAFLRFNYLASITWSCLGLLLLLAYPFNSRLLSPLVVAAGVPYFLAMASDLRRCGYKRSDVARIYGFNLVLLPVNLSGVLKSLRQALTGRKQAFARTPKVHNRTAAPASFVMFPYLLVALSVFGLWRDVQAGDWIHAAFGGLNAALAAYATVAFIGLRNSAVDVVVGLLHRLYKPEPAVPVVVSEPVEPAFDWVAVLHHGSPADPDPSIHDWAVA